MTLRHPSTSHRAAARRWVASARASLARASASHEAASYWLLCACEDFLRADEHRALARKWRMDPRRDAQVPRPLAKTRPAQAPAAETDGAEDSASARPRLLGGYYLAARQALHLARLYASEAGTSGRRERECIAQALAYRAAIRQLRAEVARTAGPSVHKVAPPAEREAEGTGT